MRHIEHMHWNSKIDQVTKTGSSTDSVQIYTEKVYHQIYKQYGVVLLRGDEQEEGK